MNKNGEFVRRYKQNYKFEYLDLDWNENPLSVEEKDTNQITENLINQKLQFLRTQEVHRSKQNSKKLFFPWAYTFIQEVKKMAKTTKIG